MTDPVYGTPKKGSNVIYNIIHLYIIIGNKYSLKSVLHMELAEWTKLPLKGWTRLPGDRFISF